MERLSSRFAQHYRNQFNHSRNFQGHRDFSSNPMNGYVDRAHSAKSQYKYASRNRKNGTNSSNYLPIYHHQPPLPISNLNCAVALPARHPDDLDDVKSPPPPPRRKPSPGTATTSTQTQVPPIFPNTSSHPGFMTAVGGAFTMLRQPYLAALSYLDTLTLQMWDFFLENRQTPATYARKVHFRNALHIILSAVFENCRLFIVGSSINGFGLESSDTDLCLVVTSQELQAKRDASVVLQQLMTPLRKCSFIRNCNLIRAKVPILKFRDQLSGVECDLNVNNVVGIYNTHLLAMYTRVDWRVRPLGVFVKHWAQKMDIHDGSRGRLSTYPLLLMLIQFLQCGCSPPVLPNLQARFPEVFDYERPVKDVDMRQELPWAELRSGGGGATNAASLGELFAGFVGFYAAFDFTRWAVSVRHGQPLPVDAALRALPPHEQPHTAASFKIFVQEPFHLSNAARSLYDDGVLELIKRAFATTDQLLRTQKRPLQSLWAPQTSPSPL